MYIYADDTTAFVSDDLSAASLLDLRLENK